MTEFKFSTFSIVSNRNNQGIAIMALSDRPDIVLNELQAAKTGIDLDVRYQQLITIAGTLDVPTLQIVISKLNTLLSQSQGS